jgi:hypothetical protein
MPHQARLLQAANITGQLLMVGLAAHRSWRRALLAGSLMYGSSVVWLRDIYING